jgi:hypothetical protein
MQYLFHLTLLYLLPPISSVLHSTGVSIRCHDGRFASVDGNNKQLTCTNVRPKLWEHFDLETVGDKIAIKVSILAITDRFQSKDLDTPGYLLLGGDAKQRDALRQKFCGRKNQQNRTF